ncbi:dihydrolipoyl dehydrogenase [Erysipelothrix rhusiopathiae]|uniref:Dihydrolipoyl dehydrogenase n=2 Tax=Erysipelothrix rhusiopathiae TaxID=1648 RepID=E7FTM9_ERYRH|nr:MULTISPECIES: dihydrolipoyl dehydrogenase [Erysipelothrix]AGN23672.1 dihydrolipoamide dehydrogenase [Erysipelothrix rhusiopathiae SY1027]AMS11549.1 dihydrolipoyl dehydrogenase [Erysipelothrix rhusiopathiae]AOO68048.1 dihydrolipoyl dehydrogenase [Erysipelothrix rhusiopathiae]AWU41104.1 dihydrolipoyl dehydrogenase [Erysipelothrix rhusiopathiae]AYV34973.1 dihydrolipoyl dehydrogenase [Erysipelothrix rhusiopathiae]
MVVGDLALELDTIVIGSGPGGYVAAIRAAQLGQKVAIIEKDNIGGVCLNVGCIPSKALINAGHRYQESMNSETFGVTAENVKIDFTKTQAWKDEQVVNKLTSGIAMLLKKNKVEIIRGTAFFNDTHQLRVVNDESAQSYTFKHCVIATGSRPIEIKGFKFGKRIIDSTGGLNLKEIPKKLVVIGGGYIGSELAGVYANLGSEITILEGAPSILPQFDKDMIKLVENEFKKKDVTIVNNAMAKDAKETKDGVVVTYEVDGKPATIEADYVMVTVGRRPNTDDLGLQVAGVETNERGLITVDKQGRTSQKHIFAIGDVTPGLALAHKASYEAKVAAEAISGQPSEIDYVAIPAVCFTDPELATVGLTEKEAKDQGLTVKVSKFPFGANGRALSLNAGEGFVRLVSEKDTGLLLGGQVAGVGASDIIAEIGLAVEARMNVEDLSLTIHAHPTLSETVMDASEISLGLPIHI